MKRKSTSTRFVRVCADVVGSNPEIILRQAETWDLLPEHLKLYVRNATRRHHASELQPVLLEKLFIEDNMHSLDLDQLPGVTNGFLRSLHNRLDRSILTKLSLVENEVISASAISAFLKDCNNLEHLNLKRCYNITNDVFKEDVTKSLSNLIYLNLSFTRVTGSAIAQVYTNTPKLATLKMAGCALREGRSVKNVFPHPSNTLLTLKLRHVTLNPQDIRHILTSFPNLQNFDCSSAPASNPFSLTTFIKMQHPSELRKINLSNLPSLSLYSAKLLDEFFTVHDKLEHVYLTGVKVNPTTAIPPSSLARLKTLFLPELTWSPDFLPTCLKVASNLTYLDLSKTRISFSQEDYAQPLVFNVPHLQILSLENAAVDDFSAETITNMHTLRALFLRNTLISALGVRIIVFACPWLEEVDVSTCRNIPTLERRTLMQTLQRDFWGLLRQAREEGPVLDSESMRTFVLEKLYSEGEERDGLVVQRTN